MIRFVITLSFFVVLSQSFAQTKFSRNQVSDDIDYYVRTMKESHYNPFGKISEDRFATEVTTIKNSLPDSIGIKELVLLFYTLTAKLNDAHGTPQLGQPALQTEFKNPQFFPYKIVEEKNRIYAPDPLAEAAGIPAGTELHDINGVNLSALFKEICNGIAGLENFRHEAACRLFSYFLFLHNIQPPFTLGYKDNNGQYKTAEIKNGVPLRVALSASLPHINKPFDFTVLNTQLAHMDIRTLSADKSAFQTFLDSSFSTLRKQRINNLAIDLRHNSGGNTTLADILFSYFSNRPYTFGVKSWKVSQVYKDVLKEWGDTTATYLSKSNGSVWEIGGDCKPVANSFTQDQLFEGHVFFITGPFTFSSAMATADVVKTYQLGTLLGEPTGEDAMDFGEAFAIVLPNSKIKIQSTSSFSHGAQCNRKKNGPVMPDVLIRNSLKDKITGKDPVIDYLLNKLKQ